VPVSGSVASEAPSAGQWVQVAQGLVARELVEGFGLSERQAAETLGLVPSAVSQYLSGKRLRRTLAGFESSEAARGVVRKAAQRLVTSQGDDRATSTLLETAIALSGASPSGGRSRRTTAGLGAAQGRGNTAWIRHRIAGEQAAVTECMRLAQRSRDELTRAVFRQIASDSLRHAEIVAALAAYLDRGISRTVPSGITRADVRRLIAREHAAEESSAGDPGERFGGVMRILWESMVSDERKHDRLLELLLRAEFPSDPKSRRGSRRR
jgi:transcriptional regulator with XRE-family HTH domain